MATQNPNAAPAAVLYAANEEFARIAREGQQAFTTALTAWVESVEQYAKQFDPTQPVPAAADVQAALDARYDLAGTLLAGQRAAAKTAVSAGRQATDAVIEQVQALVSTTA